MAAHIQSSYTTKRLQRQNARPDPADDPTPKGLRATFRRLFAAVGLRRATATGAVVHGDACAQAGAMAHGDAARRPSGAIRNASRIGSSLLREDGAQHADAAKGIISGARESAT